MTRIFQQTNLQANTEIQLSETASHHLARVLRMQAGEAITVFNGQGGEFAATIARVEKRYVIVNINEFIAREVESPLELCLAQGISRGEKMDYTIQKAVELGVKKIVPLFTERCNVKLDAERSEKRHQHWQAVIISACEQSGRNRIPELLPPQTLQEWLAQPKVGYAFVLAPTAQQKLPEISKDQAKPMTVLIGPEGGLSNKEIADAEKQSYLPLNLGPRILRTETAAVAALTALQCKYGDLI